VADVAESYTGQYLRPLLARNKSGENRRKLALKERPVAIAQERSAGSR
jgi:hypothetical protein